MHAIPHPCIIAIAIAIVLPAINSAPLHGTPAPSPVTPQVAGVASQAAQHAQSPAICRGSHGSLMTICRFAGQEATVGTLYSKPPEGSHTSGSFFHVVLEVGWLDPRFILYIRTSRRLRYRLTYLGLSQARAAVLSLRKFSTQPAWWALRQLPAISPGMLTQ